MQFPTTEWFHALKTSADGKIEEFKKLGFCDACMRVDVVYPDETRSFVLLFEDYGCKSVSDASSSTADIDFTLTAHAGVWKEMFENIQERGEPDLKHTLNYLQLPGTIQLSAEDQGKEDMFYRFNETFQQFFNQAANVPTEYRS